MVIQESAFGIIEEPDVHLIELKGEVIKDAFLQLENTPNAIKEKSTYGQGRSQNQSACGKRMARYVARTNVRWSFRESSGTIGGKNVCDAEKEMRRIIS